MFCENCDNKFTNDSSNFCPGCGEKRAKAENVIAPAKSVPKKSAKARAD